MRDLHQYPTPTPESIWAILQENAQQMRETDRKIQEVAQLQKENERKYEQRIAENERERKENEREYKQRIKRLDEQMGSWANNHGSVAEEYFFNSFDAGKKDFFGEKFNRIEKNLKPLSKELKDEYDIVMFNDSSVAIVEVKYKAHENDIPQVLKKAETFRILCPDYKDFKIYLGLATMAFYPELEQECIKNGIAIIKQIGDKVIINDKHLKVF